MGLSAFSSPEGLKVRLFDHIHGFPILIKTLLSKGIQVCSPEG